MACRGRGKVGDQMQGWIKLHRELAQKAIWLESTPEQKVILITLLMMANHDEREWEWEGKKYQAKPGQFVTSLPSIVKNCGKGITIQNVRTALKRFEKYGFLTDQSTNKNRLITIVNWGLYQGTEDETNSQTNRQLTGNQQATNRQLTANKNDKNDKNDKKYIYNVAKFDDESIPMQLAKHLKKEILKQDSTTKVPDDLTNWAIEADRMIRLDKRDPKEAANLITWAQNDDFWKANILSMKKFRAQYDKLKRQAHRNKGSRKVFDDDYEYQERVTDKDAFFNFAFEEA